MAYTAIDDLVNYADGVSTIRALYAAGLVELRAVADFRESRSRRGKRWFADLAEGVRDSGKVRNGFMIRRADYLRLLREVTPQPVIRPLAALGPRSRPSALAGRD
jgi:hypothetical protein